MREDLAEIRDTAEAIALAERLRGVADGGAGFLEGCGAHKALFLEFEIAEDFLEDLAADIAEFEKAEDGQDAELGGQVGGTANLAELAARGLKVRKQLQAIVKNKFKGQTGVLAEWQTAQHLERPPKKKKPATTS